MNAGHKEKAVVLFSGGLDSTVLLSMAVKIHGADNVTALTITYGQKHDKEIEAAKAVAEHLGVNHIIRDLTEAFAGSNSSLLSSSTEEIPGGSYKEQLGESVIPTTYIPYRNGLFLSFTAAIAFSLYGEANIYYGAHADDSQGTAAYPDTSVEFVYLQQRTIFEGSGGKIILEAPFQYNSKSGIVYKGVEEYGAPLHLTWSCYEGREKACGRCSTCIDRLEAFKFWSLTDPVAYEEGMQ